MRARLSLVYRTRLSGHEFALCGAPGGRVEARGASVERAAVAVLPDQPLGIAAGGEVADGVADLVDGLEDAAVDGRPGQRPEPFIVRNSLSMTPFVCGSPKKA